MKDDDQRTAATSMRAYEIFSDAMEHEDEKMQQAFIEQACADDGALRQKVDSLFTSLSEVDDFLEDDSALWISAKDLYDVLTDLTKSPPAS